MNGVELAGLDTVATNQAFGRLDLVFATVWFADRSGWAHFGAGTTIDAGTCINGHFLPGETAGQAENRAIWAQVTMPEQFREEKGQADPEEEERRQDRQWFLADDAQCSQPQESDQYGDPDPGLSEPLWRRQALDVEFLFQPGLKPHHGVHWADPTTIEAAKEQAGNGTAQEDNHPELDFAFGQQNKEQDEKNDLQGRLEFLSHAISRLCQPSWDWAS